MSEIHPASAVLVEERLASLAAAGTRRLFNRLVLGNLGGTLTGWICRIDDFHRTLGTIIDFRLEELCSRKRSELIIEIALCVSGLNTKHPSREIEARISISMKSRYHSTKELASCGWILS